jgi:hypothetical protein
MVVVDRELFTTSASGKEIKEQRMKWPMYPSNTARDSRFRPSTPLINIVRLALESEFKRMAERRVQIKDVTASFDEIYLISELDEHSLDASFFNAAILGPVNLNNLHVSPEADGGHGPGASFSFDGQRIMSIGEGT